MPIRPRTGRPPKHVCTGDVVYSEEELEFIKAMDRYRREHNRPFPTYSEVLAVARELGYRKVKEEGQGNE